MTQEAQVPVGSSRATHVPPKPQELETPHLIRGSQGPLQKKKIKAHFKTRKDRHMLVLRIMDEYEPWIDKTVNNILKIKTKR